jgi:hypothetical protein
LLPGGDLMESRRLVFTVSAILRRTTVVVASVIVLPASLRGQGEIQGRVLADSGRAPIGRADLSIPRLGLSTTTDSTGRYRLQGIPPGDHLLVTRGLGYRPDTSMLEMDDGLTISKDVTLARDPQALAPALVTAAEVKRTRLDLVGFNARREKGVGRFVDRETFERQENGRTSTILAGVTKVLQGRGGAAWAASTRAVNKGTCAFCPPPPRDRMDVAKGATPNACYLDVYLDGALVFDASQPSAPLFNLNQLRPAEIEGVEVFTSASQMPPEYNRTSGGCGVLLIWTRH